jgi:uncharacterized protein
LEVVDLQQRRVREAGHPGAFFILAFLWTWCFWGGSFLANGKSTTFGAVLLVFGGFGPTMAAVCLTYLRGATSDRRELWSRAFDPRRLTPMAATAALAFPILVTAGAVAVISIGGLGSTSWAIKPGAVAGLVSTSLVLGPLAEELGWRGYALEPLQQRFGANKGNVLLGLIWGGWHLPLFFIPGVAQVAMGFGIFGFWAFVLGLIADSVVMGAIYNRTRKSVLAAILYHWANDFSVQLVAWIPYGRGVRASIAAVIAIALIALDKVSAQNTIEVSGSVRGVRSLS